MADQKQADEGGNGNNGQPFARSLAGAKAISELIRIIRNNLNEVRAYLGPNYSTFIEKSREMVDKVADYYERLLGFTAKVETFSFDGEDAIERFKQFYEWFRAKDKQQWAREIKASCNEIDGLYQQYCQAHVVHIFNRYSEERAIDIDKALENLVERDAHALDILTGELLEPIEEWFSNTMKILDDDGEAKKPKTPGIIAKIIGSSEKEDDRIAQAKKLHKELKKKISPIYRRATTANDELREALNDFRRLAAAR